MGTMSATRTTQKSGTSLKEGYRWRLVVIVAMNFLLLQAALLHDSLSAATIHSLAESWVAIYRNVGSAALALALVAVLNGLLSSDQKYRLLFWRWRNPLPGCRAFTVHLRRDPRIDFQALEGELGPTPTDPAAQNALWYRMYKAVQDKPQVVQVHADFLLLRDYAGLSAIFLLCFGAIALWLVPSTRTQVFYLSWLIVQFLITALAGRNYGVRLVTNSVAIWQEPR